MFIFGFERKIYFIINCFTTVIIYFIIILFNKIMMKKVVKTRAFKDRLKGHKDGVITLFSPDGPSSGWLYSASKDGCIRSNFLIKYIKAWNLIDRLIIIKHLLSRDPSIKYEET